MRDGTTADYSWLPDLVEIGGFQYEIGCRDFDAWSASMTALLGRSVATALYEIWEAIPRSAAEKFGALINQVMLDEDRARITQAYQQLNFRPAPEVPGQRLASGPGGVPDTVCPTDSASQPMPDRRGGAHEHTCRNCGMPFGHEAWECEPPNDRYCNICAEAASGPLTVWMERRAQSAEPSDRPHRPPRLNGQSQAATPHLNARPPEASAGSGAPAMHGKTAEEAELACLSRTANPTERGFAKVAGMHELKKLLYEEVVSALRDPDDLKAYGLAIPNGILLFGPPGCGKTYISRQLAEEMNYFFKEVYPSEIGSTFIHETALKIREVFELAFQHAPSIIFVDEFESMVPARKHLAAHQQHTAEEVSEFLKQLEACADRRILLIAASNEPWKIDPAVQRTGRLDKKIYVGAPDKNARAEMLRFHLYGRRMCEIDVVGLADSLSGYSASDLKLLVDEAARLARKARKPISEAYLRTAASERVRPSVTPEDEQKYLAFGQRGVQAPAPTYVVSNSALPGRRSVDLVHKWGRGRPGPHDSARSKP